MNKKVEAVYQFIVSFKIKNDGNSPSIREIASACNIPSTSMVEICLDCLINEGRITMIYYGTNVRRIKVIGGSWTLKETDGV